MTKAAGSIVPISQHIGDEGDITQAAGEAPDMVDARRLGRHPVPVDQPEGRLEAVNATEACRPDNRAVGL